MVDGVVLVGGVAVVAEGRRKGRPGCIGEPCHRVTASDQGRLMREVRALRAPSSRGLPAQAAKHISHTHTDTCMHARE